MSESETYNPAAWPRETYAEWAARMADPVRQWLRAELRAEARYGTSVEIAREEAGIELVYNPDTDEWEEAA